MQGEAQVTLSGNKLKVKVTGNSKADLQRPVVVRDGRFLDDDLGELFPPEVIAEAFLQEVAAKLDEFWKLAS